ncbi:MAG: HAD-IIA family hydrolase [Anaerolineae bacterium]|nr:HAD-IIA family hydrolase [Anaerolineae bacterium]
MPDNAVAAVLLAAGGSSRFGQPKQLLDWEGRPMIAHLADVAWAAGLSPIIVILGAEAERIAPALAERPVQILRNYRWVEGLGSSVALGVSALMSSPAAVFLQVDQPFVTPHLLRSLVSRWRDTAPRPEIVAPTWEGRLGSPVLFDQLLFPELAQLAADVGGRALFKTHAEKILPYPVTDPLLLADADNPDVYAQLQSARQDSTALLPSIRAVISDMDGVLWRGSNPLPGLRDFFALLEERGLDYMLVTNNANQSVAHYVEKLAHLGIPTAPEHVLNSAEAAGDYLAEHAPSHATVYVVGGPGLREVLARHGFILTDGDTADYVVVGWNPTFTWEDMAKATMLIRQGARFIGTNPDRSFPLEKGLVPGAGAQLALLEAATDVAPFVIGKPEPVLYEQAMLRMHASPETTLVIGDRLDTDILGGLRLGMPTAMVLSGINSLEDVHHSPIHPDLIFDDLKALAVAWRARLER